MLPSVHSETRGGCSAYENPQKGVINDKNLVKNYQNMLVVDGSMIPANLGVNPALTITALSERAMSFIPVKASKKMHYLQAEKKWGTSDQLTPPDTLADAP